MGEMDDLRDEIAAKVAEKEQLQSDINKAVAMEQYDEAGKLAPKKKKLISQTKDLQIKLQELEQEMLEFIDDDAKSDKKIENVDPNNNETNDEVNEHGLNGIVNNDDDDDDDDNNDNETEVDINEDENQIIDEIDKQDKEDHIENENNMFADMTVDNNDNAEDDEQDTVNID